MYEDVLCPKLSVVVHPERLWWVETSELDDAGLLGLEYDSFEVIHVVLLHKVDTC